MAEQKLFRDAFTEETVEYIAQNLNRVNPDFERDSFLSFVLDGFLLLGFGDRAQRICDGLKKFLPRDRAKALNMVRQSLGPEPEKDFLDGFEGFYVMPLGMYVSQVCLDIPDLALPALKELTSRFTVEGDIRPFLLEHYEKTYEFLELLTEHPSPFVRRLASEGTRPRLPLASRLPMFQEDPSPVIRLLTRLYRDENLMVRRSVANNLNDISKDNPDTVVLTLRTWKEQGSDPDLDWLTKHALRSLIKQNHGGALELLGYHDGGITLKDFSLSARELTLGESCTISAEIHASAEAVLAINYVIHFRKASGRLSPKVFRLPDKVLKSGEVFSLKKVHKFLPFKNQRFYEGEQRIELRINGKSYGSESFMLHLE
jgi:3-methyladenine DNA glycosylase AlkC